MSTKQPYRSEALGTLHETMAALQRIGAINKATMREFDEACLAPALALKPGESRNPCERAITFPPCP